MNCTTTKTSIKKEETRNELTQRIKRAQKYIREHLDTPLDIETLASEVCLSKYHFIRVFNELCGVTPYQYMLKLKLEKACEMLHMGVFSVRDVGLACGFDNSQTFRKCFKRHTGYAPSEYLYLS